MSLVTNIANAFTRAATESKTLRTYINGNAADLTGLTTTFKTNLVGAINEINAALSGAGASINDTVINTVNAWSSSKINTVVGLKADIASPTFTGTVGGITKTMVGLADVDNTSDANKPVSTAQAAAILATKNDILGGASGAYDTLGELQALMAADDTEATGFTTALGLRVAVTAQSFTAPQQTFARNNIGAQEAALIGDPTTDFVAVFVAGLA